MITKGQRWAFHEDALPQASNGVTRRILAYCENMMCVENTFVFPLFLPFLFNSGKIVFHKILSFLYVKLRYTFSTIIYFFILVANWKCQVASFGTCGRQL